MENYISINISYIRGRSNLSQEDIGNIIGTSYHAISSYEKKKSLPPIDKIQLFCKEFKLNIDDFVNTDLSKHTDKSKNNNEDNILTQEKLDKELILYNKIIDAKDHQIKNMELRIEELKKQITIFEVLLNQNGIL